MIGWIQGHAVDIATAIAIAAGMMWAIRKLPGIWGSWLEKQIVKIFDAGDDIDDELVLAICHWAEKKIAKEFPEGKELGQQKYKMVADKLISLLPLHWRILVNAKSETLAKVIEANVVKMKEILAKQKPV